MAAGAPQKLKRVAPTAKSFLASLLDHINPAYHIRRFKEDLKVAQVALANRKQFLDPNCQIPLHEIFRGKMLGAFFLSGPANILGVTLGYGWQRMVNNQWVGLFGTILLCFVLTGIWFQLVWAMDNRLMYAKAYPNLIKRIGAFEKDMLPIHRRTLSLVLTFGVVTIPINTVVVGIMSFVNDSFAKVFPTPIIIMVVEAIVASGPIVRLLGDYFDQYSYELSDRYAVACNRSEEVS